MPVLDQDGTMSSNLEAVNHKLHFFLCTGITDIMQSLKADFFSQAWSKIDIYQSKLKFTNVGKSTCESKNV